MEKAREFQKNIYFCSIDYAKAIDCVDHNKLWKILKEMEAEVPLQGRAGSRGGIPDAHGETGIHLEWKQRTPLCSRVATGIRDVLKKVSRGLSRVEAGHPGVPRLVQVTSGGFSWWL